MSTKNLGKTVIEGGRTGGYQAEVHESARQERAAERSYLRLAEKDPEAVEGIPAPLRKPVRVEFDDKLRPAYRFLDSRVGRSWNRTRALLFERFDSRSTPGRHILFDHILQDVAEKDATATGRYWFKTYWVDEQGCLQKRKSTRRYYPPPEPINYAKVIAFLGNRKIKMCGARLVWLHPTRDAEHIQAFIGQFGGVARTPSQVDYIYLDSEGKPITYEVDALVTKRYGWPKRLTFQLANIAFRQGKLLSSKDEAYFRSLPKHCQKAILTAGGEIDVDSKVA